MLSFVSPAAKSPNNRDTGKTKPPNARLPRAYSRVYGNTPKLHHAPPPVPFDLLAPAGKVAAQGPGGSHTLGRGEEESLPRLEPSKGGHAGSFRRMLNPAAP